MPEPVAETVGGTAGARDGDDPPDDPLAQQVRHWRRLSAERRSAADEPRTSRRWPWWAEIPVLLLTAFLITFLVQTFVARVYYVPSGSMEPTLHGATSGGDRILANKVPYYFHDPEQGDVVVFRGPPSWAPEANIPGPSSVLGRIGQALGSVVGVVPPNEKDYVKRVIATGGQTVSCCDEDGRVRVDGISLDEPYLNPDIRRTDWWWVPGESRCDVDPDNPTRYEHIRCFGPYTVPPDTVWVMGDNRSDSGDSTYHCRGLVPADNVQCQGPIGIDDIIGRADVIVLPPSRWGGIASPDPMPGADGGG